MNTDLIDIAGEKYLLTTARDIADRKRSEANVRELNVELEQRVEDRTHELKALVPAMTDREHRIIELKQVVERLREQIVAAGLDPVAGDPLKE